MKKNLLATASMLIAGTASGNSGNISSLYSHHYLSERIDYLMEMGVLSVGANGTYYVTSEFLEELLSLENNRDVQFAARELVAIFGEGLDVETLAI